jgi:Mn-dependent DtxR family transcriptional regulator
LNGEKEGVVRTTEIAREMGVIGSGTVVTILYALEKYGYIIRDKKFPIIKGTRIAFTDKHIYK